MTTTPSPAGTQSATRPTVLCIDDDPLVLHFYRSFLDPHGYRVLTATEGLQGIALATQDQPDVILLDVMLRGLSGYDICRKLRADPVLSAIPILLLTVWDDPSVTATGQKAGAARTLRKPADPKAILTTLEEILGQRPTPPTTVP